MRAGADRDALMRDLLGLRVALTLVGVVLAGAFALAAGYDAALLPGTVSPASRRSCWYSNTHSRSRWPRPADWHDLLAGTDPSGADSRGDRALDRPRGGRIPVARGGAVVNLRARADNRRAGARSDLDAPAPAPASLARADATDGLLRAGHRGRARSTYIQPRSSQAWSQANIKAVCSLRLSGSS